MSMLHTYRARNVIYKPSKCPYDNRLIVRFSENILKHSIYNFVLPSMLVIDFIIILICGSLFTDFATLFAQFRYDVSSK